MDASTGSVEQGINQRTEVGDAEPASTLCRSVSRLPSSYVARMDRLAASASAAMGKSVSRASVLRAVLSFGLVEAEGDDAFASKISGAMLRRGRKSRRRGLDHVAASESSK